MALAAGTDGAAGAMADAALEQGAAEDVGGGGEGGGELGEGLVCTFHLYTYIATVDRVRKVAPSGTISTLSGKLGGLLIPSGLAVDRLNNLYMSDSLANVVYRVLPDGTVAT